MTRIIKRSVDIVFLFLLTLIVYVMALYLSDTLVPRKFAYILAAGVVGIGIFIICRVRPIFMDVGQKIKRRLDPIPAWKLALFLGLFSAVTKIVLVFLFDNNADLHEDMSKYRSFAEQYATQGMITENVEYAFHYPYTTFYGWVLSPLARIFGADTKVFTTTLSILNSVAMVMLFDMLRPYIGKSLAFFVCFLYCITPYGLMQTQVLTHENALFFFHIAATWLFMKAFRKKECWYKQLAFIFGAAFLLSIGKTINRQGLVFLISLGIYAVAKIFEKGINLKKSVKLLCVFLVMLLCCNAASSVETYLQENTVEIEDRTLNEYVLPYGWSLYVGLNYEAAGGWRAEDKAAYYKYTEFDNREDAIQYQEDLLNARWQTYKDEPLKIPKHLLNKMENLWSFQMFPYLYRQGNHISDFFNNGFGGLVSMACIVINEGMFMVVFLILLIAQWKKLRIKDDEVRLDLHFRMCVVGVTFAMLLIEVSPKHMGPLYICLFASCALMLKYFFAMQAKNASTKAELSANNTVQ